jgi:hypothetical protein
MSSPEAERLLAIYLNDHLAGATLGVQLARRLRRSNEGDPEFGPELAAICAEIEADRETLRTAMDRLGVVQGRLKPAVAWFAERLGRLKPNGRLRGYSPLSRLAELEMLQVGIAAKRRLWLALDRAQLDRLGSLDLPGLAERAAEQLRRTGALHLLAAERALR